MSEEKSNLEICRDAVLAGECPPWENFCKLGQAAMLHLILLAFQLGLQTGRKGKKNV